MGSYPLQHDCANVAMSPTQDRHNSPTAALALRSWFSMLVACWWHDIWYVEKTTDSECINSKGSGHNGVQAPGSELSHRYPYSFVHTDEQPSKESSLPSSQASCWSLTPSPQPAMRLQACKSELPGGELEPAGHGVQPGTTL